MYSIEGNMNWRKSGWPRQGKDVVKQPVLDVDSLGSPYRGRGGGTERQ